MDNITNFIYEHRRILGLIVGVPIFITALYIWLSIMFSNIGVCYLIYKTYKQLTKRCKRADLIILLQYWVCMGSHVLLFELVDTVLSLIPSVALAVPLGWINSIIKLSTLGWLFLKEDNMLQVYNYVFPQMKESHGLLRGIIDLSNSLSKMLPKIVEN